MRLFHLVFLVLVEEKVAEQGFLEGDQGRGVAMLSIVEVHVRIPCLLIDKHVMERSNESVVECL